MKKLLILLLITFGIENALAGDVSRKGTTGADQLLIPVGARSIATGGAFLSNTTGVEAIYYNPAGLDVSGKFEAMFSYMSYIADLHVTYLAAGAHFGELGSIGFSFKSIDFGDIPVTTIEAPDGTGASYSPSFFIGALTYSKVITDRVAAGVNLKLVHEGIQNSSADGFALDFGVQYRFPQNLSLGVAVKNIGTNMRYSGQDLELRTTIPSSNPGTRTAAFSSVTEEFQIPSYFELSLAYDYKIDETNNILLGTAFRQNNASEDQLNLGLEYSFMDRFFARGGYDFRLENTSESVYGVTLGAGINYPLIEGVGIMFDYAYRDVKDFPTANHVFTLKLVLD